MFHGYHDARRCYSIPATTKGKHQHPLAIKARGCTALRRGGEGNETKGKEESVKKREAEGVSRKRESR
jgi:hypothetical protein